MPVILRPCDWHSAPFGRLKALPADGKPVTKWPSLDDAFLDITHQLRAMLAARQRNGTATKAMTPGTALAHAPPRMPRSSSLALPRQFNDVDRHDFVAGAFEIIRGYFDASLKELEARNPGVTTRMTIVSQESFRAVVFKDGRRAAGCYIRIGSMFGPRGIGYSGNEASADNSYNEMLSVETDGNMLFLKAGMAMFGNRDEKTQLTEDGAAEHLWQMLIQPLRS